MPSNVQPFLTPDPVKVLQLYPAFGPGHAYRPRPRRAAFNPRHCRAALLGSRIIAAVATEITMAVRTASAGGPLAVDLEPAGKGPAQVTGEALRRQDDCAPAVPVGDEPYYARFDSTPSCRDRSRAPGRLSLLAAELAPGALPAYRGLIAAKRA
jgi:hypothetical protein